MLSTSDYVHLSPCRHLSEGLHLKIYSSSLTQSAGACYLMADCYTRRHSFDASFTRQVYTNYGTSPNQFRTLLIFIAIRNLLHVNEVEMKTREDTDVLWKTKSKYLTQVWKKKFDNTAYLLGKNLIHWLKSKILYFLFYPLFYFTRINGFFFGGGGFICLLTQNSSLHTILLYTVNRSDWLILPLWIIATVNYFDMKVKRIVSFYGVFHSEMKLIIFIAT